MNAALVFVSLVLPVLRVNPDLLALPVLKVNLDLLVHLVHPALRVIPDLLVLPVQRVKLPVSVIYSAILSTLRLLHLI